MAAVDFFSAFQYKWGQLGTAEALTDDQWKVGWSFIGPIPPSVEEFNKWGQIFDEKSNYLFNLLNSVTTAQGNPLTNVSVNTLRDALLGDNLFLTQPPGTNNRTVATTAFVAAGLAGISRGRLLRITILTSGATVFTPLAETLYVDVEGCGGGGGGGGAAATGAGQQSAGAGGAGGGYFRRLIFGGFAGVVGTVGAGGIGGTGAAAGGAGGTTSFGGLTGYSGGGGGTAGGAATIAGSTTFPTGSGIPPSTGIGAADIFTAGGQGFSAWYGPTAASAGAGGGSFLGPGAYGPVSSINLNSNGFNSAAIGGGGGGALNGPSQAARKGGDGGPGIIIIREYST